MKCAFEDLSTSYADKIAWIYEFRLRANFIQIMHELANVDVGKCSIKTLHAELWIKNWTWFYLGYKQPDLKHAIIFKHWGKHTVF